MALTCLTSSGGKTGRAPGTREVFQTGHSFLKKALAPLAHDLSGQRNLNGNLVISQSLGSQENDLKVR
jgi:hypothetical protein